jgi:hypothetical protein
MHIKFSNLRTDLRVHLSSRFPAKIPYPSHSDEDYSTSYNSSNQTIIEVTVRDEELKVAAEVFLVRLRLK